MEKKNQFKLFLVSPLGRVTIIVLCYLLIIGLMMLALLTNLTPVLLIVVAICAVYGWRALNKITPNIFLWMSIGGWIVYYLIKGFLSFIIGYFVAPFQISKEIANLVRDSINKNEGYNE